MEPTPTNISYGTFTTLDMRIGTITAVEPVPETDKLLKLTVDSGEAQPRQIVSGIRHFFADYTSLVGKQATFLVNLEPRTIRGLESQGMLLAAEHDGVLALLSPSIQVPPGTKVH